MWKWCDIRPSMVTHTLNFCSAINPHKVCTHTAVNTHTPGAVGNHLCCGAWGAVGGSVPCSRAPQSYWGWRERCTFTPPHLQFLPARDSNSQLLDYESDFLIIRARLSPTSGPGRWWCPGTWMTPLQLHCCSWWWVGGEQGGFSWRPRSSPQFWAF